MAVIEARLSEIPPLSKAETPHAVSPYTSLFHRWERTSAVWFSVSQWATFLPGSQCSLICELMLRCSLGSLRHLSSLFLSAYSPPAWQKSSEDNCSARRREHITNGWGVVCFIKHDPSALWKRQFILTARTFILLVLEGKRRKQIDFEKALTAVHRDPNEKWDVY